MAQDFAKKGPAKRQRGATTPSAAKPVSAWAWLLTGLIAGTFLAFLVFLTRSAQDAGPSPATAAVKLTNTGKSTGTDGANAEDSPRFVFYTLLPESEVLVPDSKPTTAGGKTLPKSSEPENFLLQAGSFRSHGDADRRRAELLLLGFDARIDTVTVRGSETWHRVQVGPFKSRSALSDARQRLIDERIETLLIQQRP